MGIKERSNIISQVIEFWKEQNIEIAGPSIDGIQNFKSEKGSDLPLDFKEFYSTVNGMEALYPNETDNQGFLFYPVNEIVSVVEEFDKTGIMNAKNILIFAEYMQKSWWYGIEIIDADKYVIGIIPDKNRFKPICDTLTQFLRFYLSDSPILYNYK